MTSSTRSRASRGSRGTSRFVRRPTPTHTQSSRSPLVQDPHTIRVPTRSGRPSFPGSSWIGSPYLLDDQVPGRGLLLEHWRESGSPIGTLGIESGTGRVNFRFGLRFYDSGEAKFFGVPTHQEDNGDQEDIHPGVVPQRQKKRHWFEDGT